jgi:ubiquinone/menaquinone biosynthesis C-methylase UbiE
MPDFDLTAPTFELHRGFPPGVAQQIRDGVRGAAGSERNARVLDLGAGTGRIGRAFQSDGDFYIGVDASFEMLREFQRRQPQVRLVLADGACLPFRDGAFDVVMLMHVLSGAGGWRGLLRDVCRVLHPNGLVVVGQTAGPEFGIDAQMKNRLAAILEGLGDAAEQPRKHRDEALAWLQSAARAAASTVAATWTAQRTPRMFLERHRTGNRFRELPGPIRERALHELAAWAETTYGSLDADFHEDYRFELHTFQIKGTK